MLTDADTIARILEVFENIAKTAEAECRIAEVRHEAAQTALATLRTILAARKKD